MLTAAGKKEKKKQKKKERLLLLLIFKEFLQKQMVPHDDYIRYPFNDSLQIKQFMIFRDGFSVHIHQGSFPHLTAPHNNDNAVMFKTAF